MNDKLLKSLQQGRKDIEKGKVTKVKDLDDFLNDEKLNDFNIELSVGLNGKYGISETYNKYKDSVYSKNELYINILMSWFVELNSMSKKERDFLLYIENNLVEQVLTNVI